MNSNALMYLANKLKDGYVYDERYCAKLLKLINEQAGDNFAVIVRSIIEALQEQKNVTLL